MPSSLIRVMRLAPQEAGREGDWARELAVFDAGGAEPLKRDGAVTVTRGRVMGREVVVKCWSDGVSGRVKAWLRASRAWRHWRGAEALEAAGVRTARCLALARGGGREWLVMEALPGPTLLELMVVGAPTLAQERAVARAVGEGIARMQEAMIFNRDHKPSNLIVTRMEEEGSEAGAAEVAVIDCVAIRSARGMSPEKPMVRMLANLVIEPAGCDFPLRVGLMRRGLREILRACWGTGEGEAGEVSFEAWERASARALWRMVAARVAGHGSMVPRVNPLSGTGG